MHEPDTGLLCGLRVPKHSVWTLCGNEAQSDLGRDRLLFASAVHACVLDVREAVCSGEDKDGDSVPPRGCAHGFHHAVHVEHILLWGRGAQDAVCCWGRAEVAGGVRRCDEGSVSLLGLCHVFALLGADTRPLRQPAHGLIWFWLGCVSLLAGQPQK